MPVRFALRSALLVFALCSIAPPAFADGIPILDGFTGGQNRPGLASDGSGGVWVAFKTDAVNNVISNGLVKVNGVGVPDVSWANGIYSTGLTMQAAGVTRVLSNSSSRVLLLSDLCTYDKLAMGYGSDGDTLAGFPASATLFYPQPRYVLGLNGQIMSAIATSLGASSYGIRFAIVNAAGAVVSETEFPMNYQTQSDELQTVTDGAGGLIAGVGIYFSGGGGSTGTDVAIIRISADGSRPWGNAGNVVCNVNGAQNTIRVWPDGSGGALMTWTDYRTSPAASPTDIYATRYNSAGSRVTGWTANGTRVASATGGQFESRVVDDGAGGAWILWRDQRVSDIDLYYTHVLGNGTFAPGFNNTGTLLCGAIGSAADPQMVPDGAGGFFAIWSDPRDGEADLYGSHITSAGVPAAGWPADGLALCTDPATQSQLALISTGTNRALAAWRDARATGGRIYVLGLGNTGTLDAAPAPKSGLRLRAATNPVAGSPVLWLSAPAGEAVDVALVDVSGRAVRRTSVTATGGETRASFEGGPLPAGIYFATAHRGAERSVLRVCVLK